METENIKKPFRNKLVIVRGGGDLATAIIHRLHKAGYPVLILEIAKPAAIRRQVSFCEAVYSGENKVEDVSAVKIDHPSQCQEIWDQNKIPLLIDPQGSSILELKPYYVIDAIIAKKNLGTFKDMAPVTVAVGPGFEAGVDVDYVVESMRGHNLGRIISQGKAQANTGIPGNIAGFTKERVIHAQIEGIIQNICQIGDFVEKGQSIAQIQDGEDNLHDVPASIPGFIRGLIRDQYYVPKGFKIADIDPRPDQRINCFTISDKARCIAGSVLEIVCQHDHL